MGVLVGGGAADRRFVHPDIVGDVLEHQVAQIADPVIEELALKFDNRAGDFVDGLLALVNRLHQPLRGAQALLQVALGLRGRIGIVQHPLVIP